MTLILVPADSTDERFALVVSPPQQFGKLVIVDDELSRTDRADYRLTAVASSLTPFQDPTDRVAIPFTQVPQDGQNRRAETLDRHGFDALCVDHLPPPRRKKWFPASIDSTNWARDFNSD
jgi:hypothetical protein